MPRLAAMMSKFVVIRSLVGAGPEHSAGLCLTGYKDLVSRAQGGRPSLGAVVSELQGPFSPDIPPFVGLSPRTAHPPWGNPGEPGYLGLAHAPFTPFRSERSASRSKPGSGSAGLSLDERTIVPARLARRRSLLIQLDDLRRGLDHSEAMEWRGWTHTPGRRSTFCPRDGCSRPLTWAAKIPVCVPSTALAI